MIFGKKQEQFDRFECNYSWNISACSGPFQSTNTLYETGMRYNSIKYDIDALYYSISFRTPKNICFSVP